MIMTALFATALSWGVQPVPERIRTPEFPDGYEWLNTDKPLKFNKELRGQVVLIDFWTYCCINCMHVLPDLAYLEEKFKDEPFVVIGCHSAKFENESVRRNVRSAMMRYEVKHPVVIDQGMRIWHSFAVRSWPTLVLIDAEGYIVGGLSGEGHRETLEKAIRETLDRNRAAGKLAASPLKLRREAQVPSASQLAFPGKVTLDTTSNRIFVADSNHNRVIIASLPDNTGRSVVQRIIGNGDAGFRDGPATTAQFNHPQGMCVIGKRLFIADTENHLIREVNLESGDVSTFAGTGTISNDRVGGARGTQQGINSPWDLTSDGKSLFVAMAGTHQLWAFDLESRLGQPIAGSGAENIVDGLSQVAALAQPSGLALAGKRLYFADSEVSAIRGIDLSLKSVFTVIGHGLFEFGDVDGDAIKARFQHPLGVAIDGESLLVADTYNHKIKRVDPKTRTAITLFGDSTPATSLPDGSVAFYEPAGLAAANGMLFVADTNNHRIVQIEIATRRWTEVRFDGLIRPAINTNKFDGTVINTPPATISNSEPVNLKLMPRLPAKLELTADAPLSVCVRDDQGTVLAQTTRLGGELPLMLTIRESLPAKSARWQVEISGAACAKGDNPLCLPFALRWNVPLSRVENGPTEVHLTGKIAILETAQN